MEVEQSVINAFQKILSGWGFEQPSSPAEEFAQKRFLKKMELPDLSREKERRAQAWTDWITFDASLPKNLYPLPKAWYQARLVAHKAISNFRLAECEITNGSEFSPTMGRNSVEAKLARSRWDCTIDNLDAFTDLVSRTRGLKYSLRKRLERKVAKAGMSMSDVNRRIWTRVQEVYPSATKKEKALACLKLKVKLVVNLVRGSRFSTVRKNNEKNRPINVEPLCNILVQRTIGEGLRNLIRDFFGIDLDTCADKHKLMVALVEKVATIDMSNASDSVLSILCDFMFPAKFRRMLEDSRSQFVLGPDGAYHEIQKISAMGNGFTFELMTFILLCVGRQHDSNFSVFGDDIIIERAKAPALIADLERVGFVVNVDKTFIDGPFRESCGANYYQGYGYIESFDFEYPQTIGDCASLYNKARVLASVHPAFKKLERSLLRSIPPEFRGVWVLPARTPGTLSAYDFPPYFGCDARDVRGGLRLVGEHEAVWQKFCGDTFRPPEEFRFFHGFRYVPTLLSETRVHLRVKHHWAKYFMYLYSGRKTHDVIRDSGGWVRCLYVCDRRSSYRWKDVAAHYGSR